MSTGLQMATALYTQVTGTTAVSDIISTRFYPTQAPADAVAPYAIYQGLYGNPTKTHTEPSGDATIRHFQVACFAATAEAAMALRDEIVAALDNADLSTNERVGLQDDSRDDFDPVVNLYRADADFFV